MNGIPADRQFHVVGVDRRHRRTRHEDIAFVPVRVGTPGLYPDKCGNVVPGGNGDRRIDLHVAISELVRSLKNTG